MRTRGALGVGLFVVCALMFAGTVAVPAATVAQASLSVEVADDVGGIAQYGSTVTFTYTVLNTGDETVTAIAVDDTLAGHVGDIAALGPGESQAFSASIVVEGAAAGGVGTCTAIGMGVEGAVSASRDYAIDVFMADNVTDYAVSKQSLSESTRPGAVVRYRIRVRVADAGIPTAVRLVDDFDETAVTVTDAGGGTASDGRIVWDVPEELSESDVYVVECGFRVRAGASGTLRNVAALEAQDPDPNAGNDRSSATVPVLSSVSESADAEESGTVSSGSGATEPFLPFTGVAELVPLFWLFGIAGHALRRLSA